MNSGVKKIFAGAVIVLVSAILGREVYALNVGLAPVSNDEMSAGLAKNMATAGEGAVFGSIYHRPLHVESDLDVAALPLKLTVTNPSEKACKAVVVLWAEDALGNRLDWNEEIAVDLAAGSAPQELILPFRSGTGAFKVHADVAYIDGLGKKNAQANTSAQMWISALPTPKPFNKDYGLLIVNPDHNWDFTWYRAVGYHMLRMSPNFDENIPDAVAHGLQVYPLYDASPDVSASRSSMENWINVSLNLAQEMDYPMQEFINEPWIFGWRWQNVASEYRYVQTTFAEKLKAAKTADGKDIRLAGCSSVMLFTDVCEGWPETYANFDGLTDHPYDPSHMLPTCRAGEMHSNFDLYFIVSRRAGLPRFYITEGGMNTEGLGANSIETAYRIVQTHAQEVMCGSFTSCNQRGYGTDGSGADLPNSAFSLYSYMVTDRPPLADIYPYSELLWGHIFGKKKHITDEVRALPRAQDISARWEVEPFSPDDDTLVAMIWSNTGASNLNLDKDGIINIPDAGNLKAFSLTGAGLTAAGSDMSLKFTQQPVYILATGMSVIQLRDKIRSAKIENVTPVNMYALSLGKPASEKQQMIVRVQNQMPFEVGVTLKVEAGGTSAPVVVTTIPEGRLREVHVEWPGVTVNEKNAYAVKLTAEVTDSRDGGQLKTVSRTHLVNTAIIAKKTIEVDGNLGDWNGVIPLTLGSDQAKAFSDNVVD